MIVQLICDILIILKDTQYIRLNPGSKEKLGYSCGAFPRNVGLRLAKGNI